jgi:hypothetical protein
MTDRAVGLQFKNTLWYHAASDQVAKRENVSPQAASPVDKRLWPRRTDHVLSHVPRKVVNGPPERIATPFLGQIERIGDLRVPEPYTGASPKLDAQVNTASCLDPDNRAKGGETAGKINIFLPTIERQTFVECNLVLAHGRKANRHVAAVSRKCWRSPINRIVPPLQDCAPFRRGKAGAANTVGDHETCGDNDAIISGHVVLDSREISAVGQEVVIEENNNVRVGSGSGHRIALARQTRLLKQDSYIYRAIDSPFDIRRFRCTYDYGVRRTCLTANLTKRFQKNMSAPNGRDANCNRAAHVREPQCPEFRRLQPTNKIQFFKHRRRSDVVIRCSIFVGSANVEILVDSHVDVEPRR